MGPSCVYLDYWVRGSGKTNHKSRFRPQERLGPEG
jgi:arginyl-tRNA--protein-N-Asp/Glu arginylyltransferase